MHFHIRPAIAADLPEALSLLRNAGLPTEDLAAEYLLQVAENDAGLLGVIGMQHFGDTALLRSLVVTPSARGTGTGRALVHALEAAASRSGVRALWLLTIDADEFFARLGYSVRKRQRAPRAIRNSNEFARLCPADAILMKKNLTRD